MYSREELFIVAHSSAILVFIYNQHKNNPLVSA